MCHLSVRQLLCGPHAPMPYREIAYRDSAMHETFVPGISDIPIPDSSQVTDTYPPDGRL
jgi:hypothetical protein